jgi:hypothetical protein
VKQLSASVLKKKTKLPTCPPSASLRRQQQMVKSLSNRKNLSSHAEPHSPNCSIPSIGGEARMPSTTFVEARGPIRQKAKEGNNRADSISSAGEILCCSSLSSSDIRNCNNNILKKFEQEVVSKVWKGAVELGVDLASCGSKGALDSGAIGVMEEVCRKEIQENEKRDAEESSRREHRKNNHL